MLVNLTERERIVLLYLSGLMEANAEMVGEQIWRVESRHGKGSRLSAIAGAVLGRLRRKGLVLRLPELRAWRLSRDGREWIEQIRRAEKQGARMTDQELAKFLSLNPEEATQIINRLTPKERAVYERLALVSVQLEAYSRGKGPAPKDVIICHDQGDSK